MPGPAVERPRAHKLTDIEPQTSKVLGCTRSDDFCTPISSGSNMGSIARFPKLDECAHFHYEHVELDSLEVSMNEGSNEVDSFEIRVTSGDACWTLQRSYENFLMFDKQLHRCIFDRKFSSLAKLPDNRPKNACDVLSEYLNKFSKLNHEGLNCGPVLNWLQLDNRGRRILVPESDSCPINTPAVAAAYAVRPYIALAQDEISFQIGDMISVIDMPPPGESTWWRGKHGFAVGFFPAEYVAVIGDKVPRHLTVSTTIRSRLPVKPVLRKHGKLIAFFRSFILNRPSRRRLKQSGILKERVFGCDLGEHLLNSGHDVPTVLTCCAEFIEKNGLVDGIYRLSGVTSNIQRLRHAFDEDRVPALHSDESILQDIHSVASLLKMYFRELPNPLCTYQLYSTFVAAVQASSDAERLRRMRETVKKLPPPHYRTLEYLMRHLVRVAACGGNTGMTPRNVAIVWAPNLLRCKELEVGGVAALQGVGVQAVVTEFLICYAELIFGDGPMGRPKSLAITNSARLLSLEEARNRSCRGEPDYIEVGAGPAGLPAQYHTVIELPRKRNGSKRSPSLNWRALFGKGGPGTRGKSRPSGTPPQIETVPNSMNSLRRLRPVKSADSLDGEDSLGPLLGPPSTRPCGHSRSVSHDSYFDHLGDATNTNSPLDLSEIQLNFDLEEREMRMFSEEESGEIASVEASPRRQRTEGPTSIAANGGSKRKRSRLEERLHCEVELRFIDSQSPDQVMVSADVHEMETPSSLPTPGYLPLLSEASTPLTPATLQSTPLSISSGTVNSPRMSFRSFTLPLDLGEELISSEHHNRSSVSSDKASSDTSHRLSANLDDSTKRHEPYERLIESEASPSACEPIIVVSEDHEMASCERLVSPDSEDSESSKDFSKSFEDNKQQFRDLSDVQDQAATESRSLLEDAAAGASNAHGNDIQPLSNMTDLDSPMSCEQTLEDLPDSGFVICDSSDKMFTSTETQQLATNTNDSSEWVIMESESSSLRDAFDSANPAIAENVAAPEELSRTSLDLTMCSTLNTDTSCIGTSDLPESPSLNQSSADIITNANDVKDANQEQDGNGNGKNVRHMETEHLSNRVDRTESTSFNLIDNKATNQKNQNQNSPEEDREQFNKENRENTSYYPKISDRRKLLTTDNEQKRPEEFDKCHSFVRSPQKQRSQYPKRLHDASKRSNIQNIRIQDDIEVVVPSDSAAEPQEMARMPEGSSESSSLNSSCSASNASTPVDDTLVLRDTAAILQELALQRLSGGVGGDLPPTGRRRYDSERDRRSFDSEIGREIVRENKMRQELDNARSKTDDTPTVGHLPPCLRARHARTTRAALSRSLDEGKFNQMAKESERNALSSKQSLEESQHNSTPNVGGELTTSRPEKTQPKFLGGLNLDDPRCRERINKYKEERRMFLRDKFRSESFRGVSKADDDEQALLARLKQRASRPNLH